MAQQPRPGAIVVVVPSQLGDIAKRPSKGMGRGRGRRGVGSQARPRQQCDSFNSLVQEDDSSSVIRPWLCRRRLCFLWFVLDVMW